MRAGVGYSDVAPTALPAGPGGFEPHSMTQEPAAGSQGIELGRKIKSKRTISCPFETAELPQYRFSRHFHDSRLGSF